MNATLTTQELVALVGIAEDRIAQIEQAGFIKRERRNCWLAIETLAGLVKFYRDDSRRAAKSVADARLRDARAIEIEVRTAERLGKLVAIEEFDEMIDIITGTFLTELSGFPARITRDLALRRVIEKEIFEMRTRIANAAESMAAQYHQPTRVLAEQTTD